MGKTVDFFLRIRISVDKIRTLEKWKNLNAHGGFTPAAAVPPNAITPEKVIHNYPYNTGPVWGYGYCPLPPPSGASYFIS